MNEEIINLLDTLRSDFRAQNLHLSYTSKFYIRETQTLTVPNYTNESLYIYISSTAVTEAKIKALFDYIDSNSLDEFGDFNYSIVKSDNATVESKITLSIVISETSYLNWLGDNDIPTTEDFTVQGLRDVDYVFNSGLFSFSSSYYEYTSLTDIKITELPATGTLFLDDNEDSIVDVGETITLNQVIPIEDISKLTFKPLSGEAGSPYDSFDFQVSNSVNYSINKTCTINVT